MDYFLMSGPLMIKYINFRSGWMKNFKIFLLNCTNILFFPWFTTDEIMNFNWMLEK